MQGDATIGKRLGKVRTQRERAVITGERRSFFAEAGLHDRKQMKRIEEIGFGIDDLLAYSLGLAEPARIEG